MDSDGRLIVKRDHVRDIKMRELYVQVDSGEEFNLNYGASAELELTPGEHTILATNRLYTKKAEFQVATGETVNFQVANMLQGCLSITFVMFGMGPYGVQLTRVDPSGHRQV